MCFARLFAILLANALTAFRGIAGILIPLDLYLQLSPLPLISDYRMGVFVLAILGALTDPIDGAVAKNFGGSTWFGKNFDPSADAIFCAGIASAILLDAGSSTYAAIFYWLPGAISLYYSLWVIKMRWNEKILYSNWDARFGIGCFMFAGITLLGRIATLDPQLEYPGIAGILCGTLFQIRSGVEYGTQAESEKKVSLSTVRPI